jgi:hypothetical protein
VGTTNVVWTVTDIHGNTSQCTQVITITDDEQPSIVCPADIVITNGIDSCSAFVNIVAPIVADNCAVASVVNNYNNTANATDIYPVGTTNIIFTVTDIHGNTATCNMNVTVVDDEQPEIVCPADITIGTDNGVCETNVTIPAITADDECGIATIVNSYNGTNNASDIYPIGTTIVTWTVTDIHGNISQCDMTITVEDDENPMITCPCDQNEYFTGACEFTLPDYTALATTWDNCDVNLVVTQIPVSGTVITGNTTITLTATDDALNFSSCTFEVIVLDSIIPVLFDCPGNQSVAYTDDCDYTLHNYITEFSVSATDNCDSDVTITQSPVAGTIIYGNTTITITATDDSGNSTTCVFDVTPSDQTSPVIAGCPGNFDVEYDSGCGFTIPDYATLLGITVTDNCDPNPIVIQSPDAGNVITTPTTVNLLAIDNQGNMSVCAFTITPLDTSVPTIVTCVADQVVDAESDCGFTMPDYTSLLVTDDNCDSGLTIEQSPIPGWVIYSNTTVTMTVTDDAFNYTECQFNITIVDNTDPIITVCAPDTVEQVNSACNFTLPSYTSLVTASDNCDASLTYTQSPVPGTVVSGHATVIPVTITVTDDAANFTTCTFNITLNDSINPTHHLSCQPNCEH